MLLPRHARRCECTGCGECCTGPGDYFIEATRAEQRRIQAFLGISWRWFRRRYVTRYDRAIEDLRTEPGSGRRVFLRDDNRCRIYPVRPAQCRHYPFWPQLVMRRAAWDAEAKRGEGIGRGQAVPPDRIKRLLEAQGV